LPANARVVSGDAPIAMQSWVIGLVSCCVFVMADHKCARRIHKRRAGPNCSRS
jgi:hypothetical protein